jgi:HNH endonuclease
MPSSGERLVPKRWYGSILIGDGIRPDYALDDSMNGIALRSDLHIEFDACGFVLARKTFFPFHNHQMHPILLSPVDRIVML